MSERFQDKYRIESHRLRGWDYAAEGLYFITVMTYGRDCVFGEIRNNEMVLNAFGTIALNEWFESFKIRDELFCDEFILMPNHWHAIMGIDMGDVDGCDVGIDDGVIGNIDGCDVGIDDGVIGNVDDRDVGIDDGVIGNVDGCDVGIDDGDGIDGINRIETHGRASLQTTTPPPVLGTKNDDTHIAHINNDILSFHHSNHYIKPEFRRRPKSISSFVAGYKSAVLSKIDDYIDEYGIRKEKYNRKNPLWQSNYHDHIIRDKDSYNTIKNYIKDNPQNWENDQFYR